MEIDDVHIASLHVRPLASTIRFPPARRRLLIRTPRLRAMSDNEMVKRLAWAGLVAGVGALASIITSRVAAMIYRRVFGEDPPE
jgi:hypothetical protein